MSLKRKGRIFKGEAGQREGVVKTFLRWNGEREWRVRERAHNNCR